MAQHRLRRVVAASLSLAAVPVVMFLWFARPARITSMVQAGLESHLDLDVALDAVRVSLWPRPVIEGQGLVLRLRERPELPPFITVEQFSVNIGLFSLPRRHVDTVFVRGLTIAVPPDTARAGLPDPDERAAPAIIIDNLLTEDATLLFVPSEPDRMPLTFDIHALRVRDVGFDTVMPFSATLTNPKPTGLVQVEGEVGPWQRGAVALLPLSGRYTFTDADLATIDGIGGTLQASGTFSGTIQRILVDGEARVSDFSLSLGGRPLPLSASFDAIVTGTDGTTILERVDAVLVKTQMQVRGGVVNRPGPGNRSLEFDVTIEDGRIEDVLALVLDGPEPPMTGDIDLTARMALPPGDAPVDRRITIQGRFGLAAARFTDTRVQERMDTFSRRGQGRSGDTAISRVMTSLRGDLRLSRGVARLSGLTFDVPGAGVALDGSYTLASGALDFEGELRMRATVSQAVGGFSSIFIRPFNPLFRRNGYGAVVPIRIQGTRDQPTFSVRFNAVF